MLTAKFPQGLVKQHFRRNHCTEILPHSAVFSLFRQQFLHPSFLKEPILTKRRVETKHLLEIERFDFKYY